MNVPEAGRPLPRTGSAAHYDVIVIGGGPAGSTTGALVKKYAPDASVLICEAERFPRDHVGESQLPPIGRVLDEMGCWDKVEAAGFPIKIGGTFRWGKDATPWDIEFLPKAQFRSEPRPAKFVGQRKLTAFQVDRAIYDQLLLDHAARLGCEVRLATRVAGVRREGDMVTSVTLENGEVLHATYYVDASGHPAILRRAFGVGVDCPTSLKNIATWTHWDNARWAVEIGVGGTLAQIVSIPFGWMWFFPLSPTRASVGLVCPAQYYRESGRTTEELYELALGHPSIVKTLLRDARPAAAPKATKDWSFVSERASGENWFLVGEALGFADPILSAGMTLAHVGGRELAYTLVDLLAGGGRDWVTHYDANQRLRVRQHMRFAEFFYAANQQFTHLKELCRDIARDAGVVMTAEGAWQWLARGGFTTEDISRPAMAGFDFDSAKQVAYLLTREHSAWRASDHNEFRLQLDGARQELVPVYADGRIEARPCYCRGSYRLPLSGMFGVMVQILRNTSGVEEILAQVVDVLRVRGLSVADAKPLFRQAVQILELMVSEGWATAHLDATRPRIQLSTLEEGMEVHHGVTTGDSAARTAGGIAGAEGS